MRSQISTPAANCVIWYRRPSCPARTPIIQTQALLKALARTTGSDALREFRAFGSGASTRLGSVSVSARVIPNMEPVTTLHGIENDKLCLEAQTAAAREWRASLGFADNEAQGLHATRG